MYRGWELYIACEFMIGRLEFSIRVFSLFNIGRQIAPQVVFSRPVWTVRMLFWSDVADREMLIFDSYWWKQLKLCYQFGISCGLIGSLIRKVNAFLIRGPTWLTFC